MVSGSLQKVRFYFILYYFILYYFILFYFILSKQDSLTFFNFFYKILKKIEYNKLLLMKSII